MNRATTMGAEDVYRAAQGMPEHAPEQLDRRVYAKIATVNPDGSPHVVPLMFTFDGERFLFESRSTTRKVRNVESRGWARVLVENAPEREGWIAAEGPADIVRGEDAQRLNEQVVERYVTEAGRRGWANTIGPLEDVTIVLTPQKWSSWDVSTMFDTIVESGYSEEEALAWFLPLNS